MTANPLTPAAMRRKIERLEAEIEQLRKIQRRSHEIYADMLHLSVDSKTRIEQAIRILQGADE